MKLLKTSVLLIVFSVCTSLIPSDQNSAKAKLVWWEVYDDTTGYRLHINTSPTYHVMAAEIDGEFYYEFINDIGNITYIGSTHSVHLDGVGVVIDGIGRSISGYYKIQ